MLDGNFKKLQGMNLNFNIPQSKLNPVLDIVTRINKDNEQMVRLIQETQVEKKDEELRRHNEVVNALKEAGENGATIIIGDNANGIQIQQKSNNSSQTMTNSQSLDYPKAKFVLEEIKSYFDSPHFIQTYGDNTDNIKSIVETTLSAIEENKDEGLVKKYLRLLKDLTVGTSGSLIATGIVSLLGTLPL